MLSQSRKEQGWGWVKLSSPVPQLLLPERGEEDDWEAHWGKKILSLRNPKRREESLIKIRKVPYVAARRTVILCRWMENGCSWKGCNMLSIRGLPQVNKHSYCNFVS